MKDMIKNGDFYSTKDLPVVVPKNKQQAVLRNSRKFFGVTLLLFTGLGMYFLYLGITETELNNRWLIFVLSGLSFIGAIFYYRQYADSSDKLSFSIRGVQSNSALIQWQEIIDASIQIITREHSNSELLILNLIDGSEKKIDLTFLDNTAKNIGGIFEYFRRRAQNG